MSHDHEDVTTELLSTARARAQKPETTLSIAQEYFFARLSNQWARDCGEQLPAIVNGPERQPAHRTAVVPDRNGERRMTHILPERDLTKTKRIRHFAAWSRRPCRNDFTDQVRRPLVARDEDRLARTCPGLLGSGVMYGDTNYHGNVGEPAPGGINLPDGKPFRREAEYDNKPRRKGTKRAVARALLSAKIEAVMEEDRGKRAIFPGRSPLSGRYVAERVGTTNRALVNELMAALEAGKTLAVPEQAQSNETCTKQLLEVERASEESQPFDWRLPGSRRALSSPRYDKPSVLIENAAPALWWKETEVMTTSNVNKLVDALERLVSSNETLTTAIESKIVAAQSADECDDDRPVLAVLRGGRA